MVQVTFSWLETHCNDFKVYLTYKLLNESQFRFWVQFIGILPLIHSFYFVYKYQGTSNANDNAQGSQEEPGNYTIVHDCIMGTFLSICS